MSDRPEEWQLHRGGYVAAITAVGATLRSLTLDGRDLVVSFPAGAVRPLYRGAHPLPWPNRIADGRYTFAGVTHQAALNEVDRGHALHGLAHWVRWEATEIAADRLVLVHDLVAQEGYPFPLHLQLTFALDGDGLHTTLTATNTGAGDAPYGCCPHPYLVAGTGPLDSWRLTAPVGRRVEVDERLIPNGTAAVDAVDNDFRAPAVIGTREIDHCFTDVAFTGGVATVRVEDPAHGTGVELSWGAWAPWLQIHTGDRPEPEHDRAGLAVEPMNCPPDAFNLPADEVPVLAAGSTHTASWSIRGI